MGSRYGVHLALAKSQSRPERCTCVWRDPSARRLAIEEYSRRGKAGRSRGKCEQEKSIWVDTATSCCVVGGSRYSPKISRRRSRNRVRGQPWTHASCSCSGVPEKGYRQVSVRAEVETACL